MSAHDSGTIFAALYGGPLDGVEATLRMRDGCTGTVISMLQVRDGLDHEASPEAERKVCYDLVPGTSVMVYAGRWNDKAMRPERLCAIEQLPEPPTLESLGIDPKESPGNRLDSLGAIEEMGGEGLSDDDFGLYYEEDEDDEDDYWP